MTEKELRKIVRRELLKEAALTEGYGPGALTGDQFKRIWSSVTDALEVVKVVLKDVLSSSVYLFDVIVAVDPKEMEEARNKFIIRKNQITDEYASALSKVQENFGPDFKPFMLLAAPGPYILQSVAMNPTLAKDIARYLDDVGVSIEPGRPASSPLFAPGEAQEDLYRFQYAALSGGKTKLPSSDSLDSISDKIIKVLNKKLGVSSDSVAAEGVRGIRKMLIEAEEEDVWRAAQKEATKNYLEAIKDALEKADPAKLVDPKAVEDIIKTKKEELQKYVAILNSPAQFVAAIGTASTFEDIKKAVEYLKKTPYTLKGLGPEQESKVKAQAKVFAKETREKKKVAEVMKAADPKSTVKEPTDEELYEACLSLLTRNAISELVKMFNEPESSEEGKKFLAQEEKVRESLLEEFMKDFGEKDIDVLKKQGGKAKEIADLVTSGVEELKSSGLRALR